MMMVSGSLARLQEAVDYFNAGEYYAAHDAFEALWHVSTDPKRTALQGMLQTAVGLYHMLNGVSGGGHVLGHELHSFSD